MWSILKNQCLYTFKHHNDPITCAHWNSYHPAMFASADSSGNVMIMNLFKSFEEPVYKTRYSDIVFSLKWDSSGQNLAITDGEGNVVIKTFSNDFFTYSNDDLKFYESNIKHEN